MELYQLKYRTPGSIRSVERNVCGSAWHLVMNVDGKAYWVHEDSGTVVESQRNVSTAKSS